SEAEIAIMSGGGREEPRQGVVSSVQVVTVGGTDPIPAQKRHSAGLLLFRHVADGLEVLVAHMGGTFWARKDEGAWSIRKGEYEPDEDPRVAAAREFAEELGSAPPDGPWVELGDVRQSGGKVVTAFALRGDFDPATAVSNTFELEWPRGSGRIRT